MNVKDTIQLGLLGVGVYLLYLFLKKAPDLPEQIGSKIGEAVFDFFHPDPVGETYYFTATFPDGSRHAIASGSVRADRTFVNSGNGLNYDGDGKTYKMYDGASGQHYAILVS